MNDLLRKAESCNLRPFHTLSFLQDIRLNDVDQLLIQIFVKWILRAFFLLIFFLKFLEVGLLLVGRYELLADGSALRQGVG